MSTLLIGRTRAASATSAVLELVAKAAAGVLLAVVLYSALYLFGDALRPNPDTAFLMFAP
jgi:hypothetical protein